MPPAGGNRDEPTVSSESESAARGVSGLSISVTAAAVSSKFIHSSIYIRSTCCIITQTFFLLVYVTNATAGGNRDEPTVSSESESAARGVSRLSTSVTADYSGLSSSVTAAAVSSKFIHSSIYIRSTGLLLYNYAHMFM